MAVDKMMDLRQIGGFLVYFRCATVLLTLMAAVLLTLMVVILRAHIAHRTQSRRLKAQQSPTACAMLASIKILWNVLHARLIPIRPWAALAPWTVCATLDSQGKAVGCAI